MDIAETARAYRRRADRREAERLARYEALWSQARELARALRERFGRGVRVYAFGSVLDIDRFRAGSDLDLAVEGLSPAEYWEAWRIVEALAGEARVDLIRFETAASSLRDSVRSEGRALP